MKTEKEKMVAGEYYNPYDSQLRTEHLRAKKLFTKINELPPEDLDNYHSYLDELVGSVGKESYIQPPLYCDYGYNIHIGDHTFCNYSITILDCAPVHIGSHVLIGPNVGIYAVNHAIHPEERCLNIETSFEIHIDDNVWIGGSAVINPGVRIGKGSIIGSGSVVTKDIPAGVIAAGNPCKVLRKITEEDRVLRK